MRHPIPALNPQPNSPTAHTALSRQPSALSPQPEVRGSRFAVRGSHRIIAHVMIRDRTTEWGITE